MSALRRKRRVDVEAMSYDEMVAHQRRAGSPSIMNYDELAGRRGSYIKPSPEEAARFAATNKAWLKMQRRKRLRHAIQWAVVAVVVSVLLALGMALLWLVIMGLVILFDGLAVILF
jgi:hypothetical protein